MSSQFSQFNWGIDDEDEDVLDAIDRTKQEREAERKERLERTKALEAELSAANKEPPQTSVELSETGEEQSSETTDEEQASETLSETSETFADSEEEKEADNSDEEQKSESEPVSASPQPPKQVSVQSRSTQQKPVRSSAFTSKRNNTATGGPRVRGDVVQIRDFPASVATHIQGLFPERPAMGRALAAYVMAMADIDLSSSEDIPKDIRELSRQLSAKRKNASVTDLYERLTDISEQVAKLSDVVRELEIAVAYIIFDRAGFRQEDAPTASDIDMLEDGVMDLVDNMRKHGKLSKNEDQKRHGRAIR